MVFSYNWLQSFFKKKLPKPEKLAELLTLYFAEVEEVKKPAVNTREGNDFVLDIDIRPNRAADCFSHIGVAREIATILNYKLEVENGKLIEDKNLKAKDFVRVEVKNKNVCPRYTARVIIDVKVGFSPKWLRQRLESCGLRPINNIVDIANYVMLETGQPLHGFDGKKLKDQKIIVRFAKKGEKIATLDGEKYELDKNILVIADEEKPIAIAGIKGGKLPEIDNETKIVVLESANFDQKIVRNGSKTIDLKTDASWRFEHGIDPNLTEIAINRAAYLIQEIAKGKVTSGLIDVYYKKVLPKIIKLDLNYAGNLLGVKISEMEIRRILESLGIKIKNSKLKIFTVEIPTYRLDILLQEDLIEEIGRTAGYQKIPSNFPITTLIPPKRNLDIFWEDLSKDILKESGFSEVYNYAFISDKDTEMFKYNTKNLIEIENPINPDFKYLRPSLIPNLLKNVEKNFRDFSEIKIFEIGKIFKPLRIEKSQLSGLITGDAFYQIKGVIDLFLNKLGIGNIWYDNFKPTPEESKLSIWYYPKCAEIKVDKTEIGFLGEISPKIIESLDIKKKVFIFDIDFEKLSELASEEHEYQPISKFPAAVRDIAILVPKNIRVEEVLNRIETIGGELIRDIDLFDIYEGEQLPGGKKNLAFHIVYQAKDRTLSSEEIDDIQRKIIKTLEAESEWQVRK